MNGTTSRLIVYRFRFRDGQHMRAAPEGPKIVDTHSKMLSPFGPAEQLLGGSKEISASSFWMRFAADVRPAPFTFDDIWV